MSTSCGGFTAARDDAHAFTLQLCPGRFLGWMAEYFEPREYVNVCAAVFLNAGRGRAIGDDVPQ
jgi:hypothetical protein